MQGLISKYMKEEKVQSPAMVVVTKSKREQKKGFYKCRSCLGTDTVSHPFLCKIQDSTPVDCILSLKIY